MSIKLHSSGKEVSICGVGLAVSPKQNSTPSLFPSNPRTVFTLLLALGVTMGCVLSLAPGAKAGPQGATPWVIIKCKFSDQAQEPVFDPAFITGNDGMAGYWRDVSYGQISLNGSTIHGWYTLPITLAQGRGLTRQQRIDACIAAATDVDVSQYYGVIAVLNTAIDSGASGVGTGRVLLDPYAWNVTFAAHEMGHGYGLQHSWRANPDTEYGNPWDIMSALSVLTFHGAFGRPASDYPPVGLDPPPSDGFPSGPGLNAPNLDKLGWIAANRSVTWDGTSETVTLAALNRVFAGGYLMAKVPIGDANHYYTIELRAKVDWDQGIPQDTVLINEVRPNGLFYLIDADSGPERLPNQTFHDVTNNLAITVLNIDSASSTARVNIGRNELWVDFPYVGPESGSFSTPYNTVAEAIARIVYGGTVNFKTGSSSETPTITTPMTLKAFNGPVTIGL